MKKETNKEHFFGDKLISDTIMLLTYDNHGRAECRLFKETLKNMKHDELMEWLNAPKMQGLIGEENK